jgi:hypothetical protein
MEWPFMDRPNYNGSLNMYTSKFLKARAQFRDVHEYINNKYGNYYVNNNKIKSASSSIQIPQPFEFFERTIKQRSPQLLGSFKPVTKEDVIASDLDCFKRFDEFSLDIPKSIDLKILIKASEQASKDLGIIRSDNTKHKLISLDDSISSFSKSTNSGFPYYGRKNDDKIQSLVKKDCLRIIEKDNLSSIITLPTTVFHRFQNKNVKGTIQTKIRQVWGEPYTVNSLSGIYFRELIENCKSHLLKERYPSSTYGRSLVEISDTIIREWKQKDTPFCSIDIEKMDSNIPTFFWPLFYVFLADNIDINTRKEFNLFKRIMFYQCYTPYCYRGSKLNFQNSGNSSGSILTSLFATWVTRVVVNYIFYAYTAHFAYSNSCNLGDDNIIRLDPKVGITLSLIILEFQRFGFTIPEDSCLYYNTVKNKFQFLGYIWDDECRPSQSKEWFVVHFVYPQRFFRNLDIPVSLMQVYRAISIAAPLYNGMNIFHKYLGRYDSIYREMLKLTKKGNNVCIRYYGEDQRLNTMTIPLTKILEYGWRYYSEEVNKHIIIPL